jgi:hypothetical protein
MLQCAIIPSLHEQSILFSWWVFCFHGRLYKRHKSPSLLFEGLSIIFAWKPMGGSITETGLALDSCLVHSYFHNALTLRLHPTLSIFLILFLDNVKGRCYQKNKWRTLINGYSNSWAKTQSSPEPSGFTLLGKVC